MNKTQEQLEKLRKVAELSLNKTEELQKVLAQIEALMSNTERQEVLKKKKDQLNLNFIYSIKQLKTFFRKMWKKLWKKSLKAFLFSGLTNKRKKNI